MERQFIFKNLPKIETENLLLRKLKLEDEHDIFEYAQDSEVTKYVMWEPHFSSVESLYFIQIVIGQYNQNQPSSWGIEHKKDKKLIGTIGFTNWAKEHKRAEIGFVISRNYWNKGYATEALKRIIKFGFIEMQLNRIEARCEVSNVASSKVLDKVGMKCEGILRNQMFVKEKFRDYKIYSILKNEFRA